MKKEIARNDYARSQNASSEKLKHISNCVKRIRYFKAFGDRKSVDYYQKIIDHEKMYLKWLLPVRKNTKIKTLLEMGI